MCRMIQILLIFTVFITSKSFALFDPLSAKILLADLDTVKNTAKEIEWEAKLYKYQVRNSGRVSDYQWRNTLRLMQQMDQISRRGQALSYSAGRVDTQFRQTYPNYATSGYGKKNYQQAYQDWNETSLNTFRNTLRASGVEAANIENEQQYLSQLRMQGQTAQGRMQVMQVSTELAAENVNQLQSLKRLMMAQANSQNAYMAYQVSKDSYNEKNLADITKNTNASFPKYHNNNQFGKVNLQ